MPHLVLSGCKSRRNQLQPIQRKTGMQRTLVQQYVEVDIEKSEVGLWVDINKQSYSLNTQVTKCEMDLSELKWKG